MAVIFENSNQFIVTKPRELTNTSLVASNIPEDDYPEYDPAKTYTLGERCITLSTHDIWQSTVADNLGNDPSLNPDKWRSPGKVNRWRAFDPIVDTQSKHPDLITYEVKLGSASTSVNFINVSNCTSITVRVVDPVYGQVFSKTKNMTMPPQRSSWWMWFFGGRNFATFANFNDLPAYPNATLHLELTGGEELGVGGIVIGQGSAFGVSGPQPGARVGMTSHSVRERDDFGMLKLVPRLPSKRMNFTIMIGNNEVDSLNRFLMSIDAIPCFFSGSREFDTMNVYGIIGNFDTAITYPNHSLVDIEIDGFQ